MEQAWRWFGENDLVTLDNVKQAGATGIVTSLHHVPPDQVMTPDEIAKRKRLIEAAGLRWSVCESIPTPNPLKRGDAGFRKAVDTWKDSLANLGRAGIPTVCYNFMPVVDWTRTDLHFRLPTTGLALRFDMAEFVAYDVFVLKRPDAEGDYQPEIIEAARRRLAGMSPAAIDQLEANIIRGLPGGESSYDRAGIGRLIETYRGIDSNAMRGHLIAFLKEVVPVAAEVGVRLAIHPDDPPFSLFGLPRVVSTAQDVRDLFAAVPHEANGVTLCVGSFGSRKDNDVEAMAEEFAPRIHFAHLRNVTCEPDGSFFEDEHLVGETDMVAVIEILMREERRRARTGRGDMITFRPDHGHLLGDDVTKKTNPGYSLVGRLKGLAEIRGAMQAIDRMIQHEAAA